MAEANTCEKDLLSKLCDNSENSNNSANAAKSMEYCGKPVGSDEKKPVCILVLGMAGSGKTTFVQVNVLL